MLRQTVQDFETADADMPFTAFLLQLADGRQVVLNPGASDGLELGVATYTASGAPPASGDVFDWSYAFTVPATVDLKGPSGIEAGVPTSGMKLSMLGAYTDGPLDRGGILTFAILPDRIQVQ